MTNPVFWRRPGFGRLSLWVMAAYFYRQMMKQSEGTETMRRIAWHVAQRRNVLSQTAGIRL